MYKNKSNYRKFTVILLMLYSILAIFTIAFYVLLDLIIFPYGILVIILPVFINYGMANKLEKFYNKKNKTSFSSLVFEKTNILMEDYILVHSTDKFSVLSDINNEYSILKINDNNREISFICKEYSGELEQKLVINLSFAQEYLAHFSKEFIDELLVSETQVECLKFTFESRVIYAI